MCQRGVKGTLSMGCGIGLGPAEVLQHHGMAMEHLGQVYRELNG
jgi:hypothetical protein